MQMAAAAWDMAAAQSAMLLNGPGENPFVIRPPREVVRMKPSDIARLLFAKKKRKQIARSKRPPTAKK